MNLAADQSEIKYIVQNFHEPVKFTGYISKWPMLHWSLNNWQEKIGNANLRFRKNHYVKSKTPVWEQLCESVDLTMKEFIDLQSTAENFWLYFDYKYMEDWFKNHPDILNAISWNNFGFPEKSGKDSTMWIGTRGAHTPCHMDTYGCNLIAQVYGRKLWIMFPPEEDLKPSRIPYEESSVYSKLNFFTPHVNEFRGINNARKIILNPGDVLFLPPNWWHYVENLETAISINTWHEQPEDDRKRVEESITQILVGQLVKDLGPEEQAMLLNPNSNEVTEISLCSNLNLLDRVIEIYKAKDLNKKRKFCEKSENKPIDIVKILEENPNIEIIPKLSEEEFFNLIQEQEKRNCLTSDFRSEEPKSNNVTMLENIINSICHPQVLSTIVDKLLKD